ncbi:MAG TPA: replicative DNA helicase [Acidimicrobiia bacterium]|nr:replicative DNA helicase [Acidimicrobiia bacterium]
MAQSIDLTRVEQTQRRSPDAGRIPPHNLEAEESLLGAMMLSREAITAAIEARLEVHDFYKPAHGAIFDAAFALHSRGEPVDPVTVAEELRRSAQLDQLGGRQTLLRIQAATPASANAQHYAQIVSELAMLRRLIETAGDIQEMAYAGDDPVDETLDRAEAAIFEVAERRVADSLVPLYPALEQTMNQLESLYDRQDDIVGTATGYFDLDSILLGLHPSTLTIVAARPGQGKTSLALGIAQHVAVHARKPVLFFSMEMGYLELTKRLLAAEARVPSRKLQTGKLSEHEWPRVNQAVGRLAEAPFFIDDNPHCTVMEMRAKARRIKARYGDLGLIVVDYLQLMTSHAKRIESRQVEVSELSRGLKILARELEAPVVTLSQLNRQLEYRQDKRPMLADLRESGCLTAETAITLADGTTATIGELYEHDAREVEVLTLDQHLRLVPAVMSHVFCSGVKPAFALRLASGRSVTASANHPFLTLDGWVHLDEIHAGVHVAASRRHGPAVDPMRDTIPREVWDYIERKGLLVHGSLRAHDLVERLGGEAGGCHRVYEQGVSRALMRRIADALPDDFLSDLGTSDVLWDEVVDIVPVGDAPVFDATVPGTHNFVANDIVVHNSIEQDADVVLFIYRDEYYNPDSDQRGLAEIIVAKHRNGPVGHAKLVFHGDYTTFENAARE